MGDEPLWLINWNWVGNCVDRLPGHVLIALPSIWPLEGRLGPCTTAHRVLPLSPVVRTPARQALGSTEHSHGEPPTPSLSRDQWL